MGLKYMIFWSLFYVTYCYVDPNQVMSAFSATIGTYVLECWQAIVSHLTHVFETLQISFERVVIVEFLNYWNQTLPLVDPNMGCVVMWVLNKLDLVEHDGTLRKENAKVFLMAKGSDELMADTLIKLYDLCLLSIDLRPDYEECQFGLLLAQCFKHGVQLLQWTPPEIAPDQFNEEIDDFVDYS